ncbi:ImmA/IrrE family metallo-endopeptidase [Clostridium sp.]|uniref:ImmA/IrrE family metallo-endopeptidase n=1 Tax=Clostridium sp. TaxID=1506 RepID=UPI002625436F|nr:ImmA/IrrE family metallo-endopeptidase [Clostridium sp.]
MDLDLDLRARTRAREKRQELLLGDGPINDIFLLIESLGIILFKKPFESQSLSALFMKDSKNYIMVINSNKTLGHQIYSAAHELSHFFFDKGIKGGVCSVNASKDTIEVLADKFAEYFLMPDETIVKELDKKLIDGKELDVFDIIYLQHYFKVSWKAILIKLKKLGYIKDINKYNNIGITKLTAALGYNTDLVTVTKEQYISKKYLEKALKCYDSYEISEKRLEEYLNDVDISITNMDLEWENNGVQEACIDE